MDLTHLIDSVPELRERIGGVDIVFSEIPIEGLARLQAWIKEHVPNPLEAIRDHLAKLPPAIATDLAERARREARDWPPEIGTADGATSLLGSENGQIWAFYEGIRVHHPDATITDASRLYRVLKREVARSKDERRVRRIFATIFGTTTADEDDEVPALKNGRTPIAASIGG
jgi:hypothetical protein